MFQHYEKPLALGGHVAIQDEIPKSRITLRYRTDISGEPKDITLPFRLLILGDFSNENPSHKSFEERQVISFDAKNRNLSKVMEEMKITLEVTDTDNEKHTLPIKNIKSFLPIQIINEIPKLKKIADAKNKLNALVSSINNSSKFRNAIKLIIEDEGKLTELKKLLSPSYADNAKLPERPTSE